MKIKLLAVLLLAVSGQANAAVDYNCQNNCTSQGYQYGYCKSACTYSHDPIRQPANTDYQCVNSCQVSGNLYNYCKQACSY